MAVFGIRGETRRSRFWPWFRLGNLHLIPGFWVIAFAALAQCLTVQPALTRGLLYENFLREVRRSAGAARFSERPPDRERLVLFRSCAEIVRPSDPKMIHAGRTA